MQDKKIEPRIQELLRLELAQKEYDKRIKDEVIPEENERLEIGFPCIYKYILQIYDKNITKNWELKDYENTKGNLIRIKDQLLLYFNPQPPFNIEYRNLLKEKHGNTIIERIKDSIEYLTDKIERVKTANDEKKNDLTLSNIEDREEQKQDGTLSYAALALIYIYPLFAKDENAKGISSINKARILCNLNNKTAPTAPEQLMRKYSELYERKGRLRDRHKRSDVIDFLNDLSIAIKNIDGNKYPKGKKEAEKDFNAYKQKTGIDIEI